MKKFAMAIVCTFAVVGFVLADEFTASITKVDGNKVTYFKTEKGKKADKDSTSEAAKDVSVLKGAGGGKKGKAAGDPTPITDGLKDMMFTTIDAATGVNATITTDDKSGQITKIVTKAGKGGGKKGKAAAAAPNNGY